MPKVIRCECGSRVECEGMTTACRCGALYNWAGQALRPEEEWEEEWSSDGV